MDVQTDIKNILLMGGGDESSKRVLRDKKTSKENEGNRGYGLSILRR